ncbi:high affinity cationic amino acid transporter 1-like [Myzus persicae]|uniref:high affinity cationic amino acid transporter 1-like n=1 Tax=Myzus persicae TaxID=13164 RepID=UPI000B938438|nr:high affinity cationic amino acid transporter 1-like [Myzus persicae]
MMDDPWYKSTDSLTWALTRKKTDSDEPSKEKLNRVLTFFDLTALGTGSTLGCGVYVLAGAVAKSIAGPAVVLSFAIAAVVSAFSGLCYAEFAGRVPKAGSAYIYSYVAVGEFTAFVIGWNLLIEHLIGTAAVAKAMSNYCDSLLGNPQRRYMTEYFPIHIGFLADYPDLASFLVIVIISQKSMDPDAPLPALYENLGMPTIKIIVSGGAIFALCTSLLGAIFPLPRILYSMASDGLLFKFLSNINSTTKTPLISTIICGVFAGTLAAVFNLEQLIDMASIGTLQAYTIVCICVLILRYTDNSPSIQDNMTKSKGITVFTWLNLSNAKVPNSDTQYVSRALIFIFSACTFVFAISLANMESHHGNTRNVLMIINVIALLVLLVTLFMLGRLPTAVEDLSFKVPLVPIIPCLSIVLNVYLMMELEYKTWIRFIVWLICGLLIYLFYGIGHSLEGNKQKIQLNTIQIKPKL